MANIVRNFGWIENLKGERKDVNVKLKMDRKDLGVGVGAIAFGVCYLIRKALISGAASYMNTEVSILQDLGIINDVSDEVANKGDYRIGVK